MINKVRVMINKIDIMIHKINIMINKNIKLEKDIKIMQIY
jgi:hypothetical protein